MPTADIAPDDPSDISTMNPSSGTTIQRSRARQLSSSSHVSSTASSGRHASSPEVVPVPFCHKDVFRIGSSTQLRRSRASLTNSNINVLSAANDPATTGKKKENSAFRTFADTLIATTDFSILRNKQILLICIGNIFSMLGYYLPILCLVSFAVEDLNINKTRAAFLLTIFGIRNKPIFNYQ